MKQLSVEWLRGVAPDKRKGFEEAIRNSSLALGRLYDLLAEWEADLDRQETTLSDFTDPAWAYKQAYRNGDRSRIRRLRDLLSFLKGGING